jgi:hypothetical protein
LPACSLSLLLETIEDSPIVPVRAYNYSRDLPIIQLQVHELALVESIRRMHLAGTIRTHILEGHRAHLYPASTAYSERQTHRKDGRGVIFSGSTPDHPRLETCWDDVSKERRRRIGAYSEKRLCQDPERREAYIAFDACEIHGDGAHRLDAA